MIAVPLKDISYIDYPELQIDEHESTEMPFRYVKNPDGSPCMPEVSYMKLTCQALTSLTHIGNGESDQG